MLKDLNTNEIEEIFKVYKIQYLPIDGKGCVNYDTKTIGVNRLYENDKTEIVGRGIIHIFDKVLNLKLDEDNTKYFLEDLLHNKDVCTYIQDQKIDTKYCNCSYEDIPPIHYGWK